MVTHIVMWRVGEEGGQRTALLGEIKTCLEGLRSRISELVSLEVGLDRNRSEAAFDIVLHSTFADFAALERYQAHPAHQEAAAFIRSVTRERAVVDYES